MSTENLFKDFDSVSAKAWKQKIQFDLKGADYNETLVWESPEGIKVKPFYHADDEAKTMPAQKTSGWHNGKSIYAGNAVLANENALMSLENGAESLIFVIPSTEVKIEELLKDIKIKETPIYFEFQFLSSAYIKKLLEFVGDAKENSYLNIDIIGNLGRSGNWFLNLEEDHDELNAILGLEAKNTVAVDVSLYQNAGANMVQQLGYALGHANEYLNEIDNNSNQLFNITFKVSVGTNYFFEIAKLRALRLLWNTLAHEYGVCRDCHIIATPTKRNKTLYDYNTNMLRTTTESMAAVLGGANMVCNMPYDAIYHKENDFGNRIAINQLLLLKNESYFDKIDNAADGAYYIEALTEQLANKGLELFKSIEKGGGFLKQLKTHTIQKKIKESAQKEQAAFESGKEVLVGTNKFLNEADKMKDSLELYPFVKTNARKTLLEPIIERRLAEDVEQKRLKDE
ncbi:methylmalonyl-CoA mutase subunit beta [uncultured Croceitalea sp.]|uniref:methylmalonyl-CoA mutase subunit beta n=1 Tax=uncultured Croceitalea sp. TaxID=1798908 RepID=UPI00374FBB14